MSKLILGQTGPSVFNDEVKELITDYYGATPFYITQDKENDLEWVLKHIKGLVLAGGRDLHPITYESELTNNENLSSFDRARDLRELYLIKRCFELDIPILGICKGHQMLGIYHNLYLIKDISGSEICHNPNAEKIDYDNLPAHFVYCLPEHQKEFFGREYFSSFHHQALYFDPKDLNPYLSNNVEVIGYAHLNYTNKKCDEQKIIELMRGTKSRWISHQGHLETEFKTSAAARIVLDKFKVML